MRKQCRKIHSSIMNNKIVEPLESLHMDLCGPSSIKSISGNKYILTIIDDFFYVFSFINRNLKLHKRWSILWKVLATVRQSSKEDSQWQRDWIQESSIFGIFREQRNQSQFFISLHKTTKLCCWKAKLFTLRSCEDNAFILKFTTSLLGRYIWKNMLL